MKIIFRRFAHPFSVLVIWPLASARIWCEFNRCDDNIDQLNRETYTPHLCTCGSCDFQIRTFFCEIGKSNHELHRDRYIYIYLYVTFSHGKNVNSHRHNNNKNNNNKQVQSQFCFLFAQILRHSHFESCVCVSCVAAASKSYQRQQFLCHLFTIWLFPRVWRWRRDWLASRRVDFAAANHIVCVIAVHYVRHKITREKEKHTKPTSIKN